jgi:hypothetical protein
MEHLKPAREMIRYSRRSNLLVTAPSVNARWISGSISSKSFFRGAKSDAVDGDMSRRSFPLSA